MIRIAAVMGLCVMMLLAGCQSGEKGAVKSGWISLFDGQTLNGWRANENKDTFSVEDGMILVKGPRSHLFYDGPVMGANFTNFEFKADVLTKPKANSGIYIHTAYQDSGWPDKGY